MMRSFPVLLLLVVAVGVAPAQPAPAIKSFSGQFIAHGLRSGGKAVMPPDLLTNANALELKPELLTISAERIKQSLWLELGAHPDWHDPIHLSLRPARSGADIVDVSLERFRNSWTYRVELPAVMERQKFVRALVNVILLEIANRSATDHSAELPAWLTEGFTERLLETRGNELMLPPPHTLPGGLVFTPTVNEVRMNDPMRRVRMELKAHAPLSLEELSWPTPAQLDGLDQGRYRQSAGLFVTELLQLTDGRAAMRAMLGELGRCYNWQTAFHRAFANPFPRPLDLEKWWALELAHLNGRDPDRRWTLEDSLRKLEELLLVAVDVRSSRTNLPTGGAISLQRVILDWDALRQVPVLKTKLNELDAARLRAASEALELIDEYRRILAAYVKRRNAPGFAFQSGRNGPPGVQQLTSETIRTLNDLDRRRAELKANVVPDNPPPQP